MVRVIAPRGEAPVSLFIEAVDKSYLKSGLKSYLKSYLTSYRKSYLKSFRGSLREARLWQLPRAAQGSKLLADDGELPHDVSSK